MGAMLRTASPVVKAPLPNLTTATLRVLWAVADLSDRKPYAAVDLHHLSAYLGYQDQNPRPTMAHRQRLNFSGLIIDMPQRNYCAITVYGLQLLALLKRAAQEAQDRTYGYDPTLPWDEPNDLHN